jgi:hypothetical protein
MHNAQSGVDALTSGARPTFTHDDMTSGRILPVLIGIVLIERAYMRSGG